MNDFRELERAACLKPGDQADWPWKLPFVDSRGKGWAEQGHDREGKL